MRSAMDNHQEDLDLLLSLEDRVLETPPGSPSATAGYLTDDESPKHRLAADLSDFRSVVQDCLDYEAKPVKKNEKQKGLKNSNFAEVEKFSGLRIRDQLLSPVEISDRFSDIRFVRLPTIKNLLVGDKLSGCWATIGVLAEKGNPKTSSIGQTYCIWKIGCLNEDTFSLFLFGDAYQKNWREQAGTVFGLFNCSVRKDNRGSGFSLSVSSLGQIVKMGTSADFGVCKGKRTDGTPCTSVINKRQGPFCKFHKLKASEKFVTKRTELKGGNLRTAFRDPRLEGIYMVDPLADRTNHKNAAQPVKVLSVEGLRKALSTAGKVTTSVHSQGIRFLNELAGKTCSKNNSKESELVNRQTSFPEKRKPSTAKQEATEAKRKKTEEGGDLAENAQRSTGKMIVLDFCSSDEE